MNYVPSVKHSGGVFEIFVPGVFLLINFLIVPFIMYPVEIWLVVEKINPTALITVGIILFVCYGYLLGMVLRLLKTKQPDNLSAKLQRIIYRLKRKKIHLGIIENFPFIGWLGERTEKHLPKGACDFYHKVWSERKLNGGEENKRFFNFCKNLLDRKDNQIMIEINAIEATLRFLSGMYFSLIFSVLILACVTVFSNLQIFHRLLILIPTGFYLFCLVVIILNYRFYRLKEVETLFDATYQNKELFLGKKPAK